MSTDRRQVLKGTVALAGQLAVRAVSAGAVGLVSGCGGGGSNPPAQAPTGLSYAGPAMARVGVTLSSLTPTVTGSATSYSVSPTLPAGLSLDGTSGVISGTPSTVASSASYTITASNSGGSTSFALTLQVLDKLAIASLSSAAPTALTPFVLVTTGVDPSKAVSVNFLIGSRAVAGVVIRVQSDGSVVVTTPIWIDPSSGKTASTTASVTIGQYSSTSNSVALTINDMPSVASYGETPGSISRSVLNAMAISMGRSINRYQAYSQVKSITTDTSTLQSALKNGVADAQVMRGNIDRLLAGAFPALTIGTATTGETLQFDASSIDVMDRILGLHLQALGFYSNTAFTDSAPAPSGVLQAKRYEHLQPVIRAAISAEQLGQLAGTVGFLGGAVSALTPNTSTNTGFDRVVGGLNGLAALVALGAAVVDAPVIVTAAVAAGVVLGAVTVGRDIYNIATSEEGASGLDYAKLGLDVVTTITGAFGALKVGSGVISEVTGFLAKQGTTGAAADAIQAAGFVANVGSFGVGLVGLGEAATSSAKNSTPPVGLADVTGTATVANSNAPILQGLSQINLTDPTSGLAFTATCDVNGTYDLTVPTGISGINYSDMQLTTSDPVTGTITSSPVPVDLSALNANATDTAPPVNGQCIDGDADSPDSDDPDCD